MGVKGGTSASRDRFSQDNWQNQTGQNTTNSSQNVTGQTDASFNSPQGQAILNSLTGAITGNQGQNYLDQAGATYGKLAGATGAVNPEVENIVNASNLEANKTFGNRLGQLRAGGYRGGTAANINGQGRYAADFSAQQGGTNAGLRYGAFNDAQNRGLQANTAGAAGLSGLGQGQQGLGSQILSLLRGQSTTGTQQTTTIQDIINALTGGSSGTKSNTSAELGFNYSK